MRNRNSPANVDADVRAQRPRATGRSRRRWLLALGALVCCGVGVVWALEQSTASQQDLAYEVVHTFPHDPQAYCQGLIFADGALYEGTGQYGQSSLRRVNLETGQVERLVPLDHRLFGEGITLWNDRIIQLTWKEGTGLIYDRKTLELVARFRYRGEGWGITHDGTHLIMSDGSPTLRFLDPETFQVVRRLTVRSNGRRVWQLNELEYIRGEIYANVWRQPYVVRISPQTGNVTGRLHLADLYPPRLRGSRDQVLNGIAYDARDDRLFVTGKNWPHLYEIRLVTP